MRYDTDDLVYGFMRSISTAQPQADGKYREYLTKKNFQSEKKVIANICGTTPKTIANRLTKLIEKGLVEEGEITVADIVYPCYFFPFDYDGIYKIVEQEMVSYLVNTRNSQAIRIYLYLLNCNSFKDDYVFTIQEIKKALGYAESTKSADKVIKDVLESFSKEGLITIEKEWFSCVNACGKETFTERMILKFIATKRNEF